MDRRTLEELLARYAVEPQIRELFVEGNLDRSAIAALLRHAGLPTTRVIEVSAIHVPAVLCHELGVPNGNAGRLVVMGDQLAGAHVSQARVLVDRDQSDYFGLPGRHEARVLTNGACLEADLIRAGALEDLAITSGWSVTDLDLRDIRDLATATAAEMAQVRIALRSVAPDVGLIERADRCITETGIDSDELIRRSLNSYSRFDVFEEVLNELEGLQSSDFDASNCINGHDLGMALSLRLQAVVGKRPELRDLERNLLRSVDKSSLIDLSPYDELVSWLMEGD